MKRTAYKWILPIGLVLTTLVLLGSCTEVTGGSNYTLIGDNRLDGTLFIFAQNATLAEGTSVDGSVVMLSCNLMLKAEVKRHVYPLRGNLSVTSSAVVDGDVFVLTGNVSQQRAERKQR